MASLRVESERSESGETDLLREKVRILGAEVIIL
ncbi:uncharacterized protein G2W53_010503 [Senna tora]|uniref:Uncharacterized protein n=1 Tax=Senna tora TaxID=362788 RepID=A0A834X001_9FABA|nr:uncharacterized protein G2W53_010503 [Senna tora]